MDHHEIVDNVINCFRMSVLSTIYRKMKLNNGHEMPRRGKDRFMILLMWSSSYSPTKNDSRAHLSFIGMRYAVCVNIERRVWRNLFEYQLIIYYSQVPKIWIIIKLYSSPSRSVIGGGVRYSRFFRLFNHFVQ